MLPHLKMEDVRWKMDDVIRCMMFDG